MSTFKQSADLQVNINLGTHLKYMESENHKMFKEMNQSLESTMDEARTLNKRFQEYEEWKAQELEALKTEITLTVLDKTKLLEQKVESEMQLQKMSDLKFRSEYRADYQRLREVMLGHKNKSILNDPIEHPKPKASSSSINKDLTKGLKETGKPKSL